jgi:hypothetical protein
VTFTATVEFANEAEVACVSRPRAQPAARIPRAGCKPASLASPATSMRRGQHGPHPGCLRGAPCAHGVGRRRCLPDSRLMRARDAVATELVKTLQQITSSMVVTQSSEQRLPAAHAGAGAASSAAAVKSGPAAAAVEPVQAVPSTEVTPATIVADFGNSARRPLALENAQARLQDGSEEYWGHLFLALQELLFHPEPASRPASSEPFISAMLDLPEKYVELLRKRLTPVLVIVCSTPCALLPRECRRVVAT